MQYLVQIALGKVGYMVWEGRIGQLGGDWWGMGNILESCLRRHTAAGRCIQHGYGIKNVYKDLF